MRSVLILSFVLSASALPAFAAPATTRAGSDTCGGLYGQATIGSLSGDLPRWRLDAKPTGSAPDATTGDMCLGLKPSPGNNASYTLQTGTTSYNSDLGFALNNGGLVTFIGGNNTPGPVVVELKDGQPLTFVSSTSTQTPISAWCAVSASGAVGQYTVMVNGNNSLFSLCSGNKNESASVLYYNVTGAAAQNCSPYRLLMTSA